MKRRVNVTSLHPSPEKPERVQSPAEETAFKNSSELLELHLVLCPVSKQTFSNKTSAPAKRRPAPSSVTYLAYSVLRFIPSWMLFVHKAPSQRKLKPVHL